MIQIYRPENTEYERNGDMTLFPASATTSIKLNGTWEAELTHPIDREGRWEYLETEAVVKMPAFNGEQLFRIKDVNRSESEVTAKMEPIFMDAMDDCFLEDVRPTNKTGQEALDIMTEPNSKYTGISDITSGNTAYYENMNLIEAINGENENSFVNRWGGEILFDNFTIVVNERVGGDYGYEIRYGKNIAQNGIQEEVDIRDVVTRIYPKAYNGYGMSGDGYVDSENINAYHTIKCAAMSFDDVKMRDDAGDDEESGVIICDTQEELDAALKKRCQEQFDSGLDKPKVTISIDLVILKNTDQYKNFEMLEDVSLGDTVHCIHSRLGIDTKARIIEMEYDNILDKVTSVVIGDYEYNYFDNVSSTVNRIDSVVSSAIRSDGTVIADKVQGFLNGVYTQLRLQNSVAQKQDARAILFEDLDPNSSLYGAMALGTKGLQISRTRTSDGKDWVWTTAMTAEGLIANIIVAGLLTDKTGKNFWNLDTGQMQLSGDFRTTAPNGYTSLQVNENILTMYNYLAQSTSPENAVFRIVSALDGQASGFGTMLSYQQDYGMSICRHQGDFGIITQSVMEFDINGAGSGIGVFEDINMNHCNITNQSDERLKENIQLVGSGDLEKLMQIPVVSFDWLEAGEHVDAGVIAQDIETLYPDCVKEDTEGVKQAIPAKLLYHLMRAVQELNDKVENTQTIQGRVDKYSREEKLDFILSLEEKKKERAERREKGGE